MDARPTEYKGIIFKSKSEAQLAYIFDLHHSYFFNIHIDLYEYEPKRFITSDRYIPDFLTTQVYKDYPYSITNTIIEYKPSMPNETYIKYLEKQFIEIIKKDKFLFIDAYLLYYGNVYNKNISCLIFEKDNMKFQSEGFEMSWINENYYTICSQYRFDL